jgi:disulfide bond formation protein DsbB
MTKGRVGAIGDAMLAPSVQESSLSRLWRTAPAAVAALAVAAIGAAAIAGAWFFELVVKLKPCPLCLEQRVPYYIAIPLALLVAVAAWRRAPRMLVILGLVAVALVMLWGAGLGVYHSGIEWKLWVGPTECSGTPTLGPPGSLLDRLGNVNLVRCDEAAWRFLGLSLAGYNVLIAGAMALIALCGAIATKRQ